MEKFVKRIIIFFIPILFVLSLCEAFAKSIPNVYKYKDTWIENHGNSIKTLVLGTSVTYYGINARMIDSCFNAANASQGLEYDDFLLKRYAQWCPNLKTVILPVDFTNLFQKQLEESKEKEWGRAIYYKIYHQYPKHSWTSYYNFEISNPAFLNNKFLGYFKSLLHSEKYDIGCDSLGLGMKSTSLAENPFAPDVIKEVVNRVSYSEKELNRNLGYLHNIHQFCQKHHYQLILVVVPRWGEYITQIDEQRLKTMNMILSQYRKEKDCGIGNYLILPEFLTNKRYYRDSNHLSLEGADEFTKIIKKDFPL